MIIRFLCWMMLSTLLVPHLSYGQPLAKPRKVWLSLGYSTLDKNPPDWKWLRAQCLQGQVLKTLEPALSKIGGIVIPVFDDGQCFYATAINPFKGRNSEASADEQALRTLLIAARKARVPVYLGVDVLRWQKSYLKQTAQSASSIFNKFPEWQEVSRNSSSPPDTDAFYASPFNTQVRIAVTSLVQELAQKFPEATGLALNLRLSRGDILGFSEAARAASIGDVSIDPIDLNLTGEGITPSKQQWIEWRNGVMASLLKTLRETYRQVKKDGVVIISGYADYYVQQTFSDVRSNQDWMAWLSAGLTDGVLLEGRWMEQRGDSRYLSGLMKQINDISKKTRKPITFIPLASGDHLIQGNDYQNDWIALKYHQSELTEVMLLVKNDNDLRQAIILPLGHTKTLHFSSAN